jgi:membrane-bound lytic murein transglycosylase
MARMRKTLVFLGVFRLYGIYQPLLNLDRASLFVRPNASEDIARMPRAARSRFRRYRY